MRFSQVKSPIILVPGENSDITIELILQILIKREAIISKWVGRGPVLSKYQKTYTPVLLIHLSSFFKCKDADPQIRACTKFVTYMTLQLLVAIVP